VHEDRALGLRCHRDRDARSGRPERGPRTITRRLIPDVGLDDEPLPAGHDHVVSLHLRLQPRCRKTVRIIRRSLGSCRDPSSPSHAGERMKLRSRCGRGDHVGAPPSRRCRARSARSIRSRRSRSILLSNRASLDVRLASGVGRSSVTPGVSAAAMSAFSVAITDGSSMTTSPARRPCGASAGSLRRRSSALPARGNASICGSAAAADHIAAGGGISARPEAREQRPREQERPPRISSLASASSGVLSTSAPHNESSSRHATSRGTPIPSSSRHHRLDVAIRGSWRARARRRSAPTRRGSAAAAFSLPPGPQSRSTARRR